MAISSPFYLWGNRDKIKLKNLHPPEYKFRGSQNFGSLSVQLQACTGGEKTLQQALYFPFSHSIKTYGILEKYNRETKVGKSCDQPNYTNRKEILEEYTACHFPT